MADKTRSMMECKVPADELQSRLEKATTLLYGGVYRRRNPVLGATKDFELTCVIFHIVVSTLKLIFGISYIHDCPVNTHIPYYMFIGGIMQIMFMLTILFRKKTGVWALQVFLAVVLIVWCCSATISTFYEWEPDFYPSGKRYCNKIIYTFAVTVCLAELVSIVLLVFLIGIAISFEVPY